MVRLELIYRFDSNNVSSMLICRQLKLPKIRFHLPYPSPTFGKVTVNTFDPVLAGCLQFTATTGASSALLVHQLGFQLSYRQLLKQFLLLQRFLILFH